MTASIVSRGLLAICDKLNVSHLQPAFGSRNLQLFKTRLKFTVTYFCICIFSSFSFLKTLNVCISCVQEGSSPYLFGMNMMAQLMETNQKFFFTH